MIHVSVVSSVVSTTRSDAVRILRKRLVRVIPVVVGILRLAVTVVSAAVLLMNRLVPGVLMGYLCCGRSYSHHLNSVLPRSLLAVGWCIRWVRWPLRVHVPVRSGMAIGLASELGRVCPVLGW